LRRPALQERLVRAAEDYGVRLLWKTPVCGIEGDTVQLSRSAIRARWIVGADGHGSRVRRWSGLDFAVRNQRRFANRRHYQVTPWSKYMEVHWGSATQGYVTPIGSDEVCVVTMGETPQAASFDNALDEMPELAARLAGARLSSRERGAVSAMCSLQRIQRGNVALLGDASGGVDAITGEGLRLAFRQAFALAEALAAGDLRQYQRAYRKIARRPMLMGHLMLWLGRHPRIRSRVIRAMQQRPELFTRMLATHVGEATPGNLLSTGAQLGLQLLSVTEKG
jgi:flavin-dependent dehydrogenase